MSTYDNHLSKCMKALIKLLKQDGQLLPPAFFPPSNFRKDAFQEDESAFCSKHTLFIYFLVLPNLKNILIFLQKALQLKWKRYFWEIISIDTHSTANLPPLTILEKISFFPKKLKLSRYLKKTYYLSHILRQMCYNLALENFNFRIVGHLDIFNRQMSVKKRTRWMDDPPSIFQDGRKIITCKCEKM